MMRPFVNNSGRTFVTQPVCWVRLGVRYWCLKHSDLVSFGFIFVFFKPPFLTLHVGESNRCDVNGSKGANSDAVMRTLRFG